MANVLTPFIPMLYESLDKVSRELVGFIPSVARNSSAERAAVGQSIMIDVSTAAVLKDVTPSMQVPEPDDTVLENVEMKITKSKQASFGFTGEEYRGLDTGIGAAHVLQQNFEQAVRTLTNSIEADIAVEAALHASRAYGTAGTTPFATSLADSAQVRKILDDNGAPASSRSLIIDTSAGASLRSLENLTNVGDAGTSMTLRDGELLNIHGFSIKESAQIVTPAVGNAAGCTVAGPVKVGTTVITLKAGTSGSIKTGDYVTFAGDTNKYVVTKGLDLVAAKATFEIAKPGLRVALADAASVKIVAAGPRMVGFQRDAIQLITRAPALPGGTDSAVDSMMLTDARSGLSFEIRVYQGYRKMRAEVACAWGVKAIKDEHIAGLLG